MGWHSPKQMGALNQLIERFVDIVRTDRSHIYNEFSLQHELGIFMRAQLPGYLVRFERNVSSLFDGSKPFEKREIDIVIFSPDGNDRKYAIELKYPRNGQHPEQMFSFCKDIKFAEELRDAGFASTAVVIFAEDRLFYEGSPAGIYGCSERATRFMAAFKSPQEQGTPMSTSKEAILRNGTK
jgi:hypothetical protein